ncbi:MAG: ABC transporter ATP-binding protein [Candidatus Promineifilaceae bacterium]|nr:ABC transporter ATP-binding protein [Candidatus Promineifilaceae bacterium]
MTDYYEFEEEEFTTEFNGRTLLRILAQTRPHWKLVAGFLFFIITVSIIDSTLTYLDKQIIDQAIIPADTAMLLRLLLLYGALFLLSALSVFGFIYLTGILGETVQYDLRHRLFDQLQQLSFSYFDRTPVGWIMSRVTSDTQRIAELVSWGLLDSIWGTTRIITAFAFMLVINWKLALIVITIIPILVIVAAQFKKKILVEYRVVRKTNSKITGAYNENITGVRVAKALVREEANLAEFSRLTDDMYGAGFRAAWLSALFLPVVQIISAVAIGAIAWFGGLQIQAGNITVGGIQAFIVYVTFMLWPIQELARVYAEMQQAIASAERVFSLVDAVPEIQDRPDATAVDSIGDDIIFDQVDFYYEADKPVLQDFNLHVRAGETIALVGPTGAGKSTIVNLLARFYEPTGGRILMADRDYRELTLQSIQSKIGVVLQTPHLFSGTIRENIRYGRLDADDEAVEDAARLAGAHEFIVTLERGYEEEVGEGGGLLSVGQKQLISLARAILAQPEIFIMDEATSSVDTLTEALIQRGMETLMRQCTSFVIAHRLSTIKRADRILVIEAGRIAEAGSHAQLIRARGHYYELYTRQFRQERAQAFNGRGPLGSAWAAD